MADFDYVDAYDPADDNEPLDSSMASDSLQASGAQGDFVKLVQEGEDSPRED